MNTAKTFAIITLSAALLIMAALACTTPEPTPAPMPTATLAPTAAVVLTPTATATPADIPMLQPTPTTMPLPTNTNTPAPTPPPTATPIPTPTPTPQPTNTPRPTSTPTPPSPITKLEDGAWLERNQPARAAQLRQLPWVADGVDDTEREAAEDLIRAARRYPEAFIILMAMSWVQDNDLTADEARAIELIRWSAHRSAELSKQMSQKPWVQDGITTAEASAMFDLAWTIREAPALAERMLVIPWIQDDSITDHEVTVTDSIYRVIRYAEAPAMAERMLELPWVQDRITADEAQAVEDIRRAAEEAPALAERMSQKTWFQDGITKTEATTLNYLRWISGKNAEAATALVAMPFLDSVEDRDMLALRSLNNISWRDASGFAELMAHPKIKDGITDEETKIVAVLGQRTYSRAPGSAEVLLTGTDVYIQERLIQLPHTGETLLAVIGVQDPDTRSMEWFEHAVRSIERFMGEPFPIDYLALLYYDNTSNNANNNFTHLLFMGEDDEVNRDAHPGVIAHEAAHWYWYGDSEGYQYRKWITEGSADFLRIISEHERIGRPLEPIKSPCGYFNNISELEKANPDRYLPSGETNPPSRCYYSLGQRFFLDLYLTLGDETFRAAFCTLYLRSQQDNFTDGCGRPPFNICRVEAAFKDGASADVIRKVDEVINRWYGPLP